MRVIGGKFKGHPLKAPKGSSTRPTQGMLREAVFNICQNEVEGARFLDLFAGSGAMGIEALSRGASEVTFVEQNKGAVLCIKENLAPLQTQARLLVTPFSRAVALLIEEKAQFDLIYVDPPYNMSVELRTLLPLLAKEAILFLEEGHKTAKCEEIPGLTIKSTRRFGAAFLTIFLLKETKNF